MNRTIKLLRYSATRLSLAPLMLWIISSMVFLLLRVAPGDPVDAILGTRASEVARAALRTKLGLDVPIFRQYFNYIEGLIHGDLGKALINEEPVSEIIARSLPASLELGIIALLIACVIGLAIGFSGVTKPEGKFDFLGRLYGISTYV